MKSISNPIEHSHPVDVAFGGKALNHWQQGVLDSLREYGSQKPFRKCDVSMLDLSAITAITGDEFAMFTRGGERLIVRGENERVPINVRKAEELREAGYRWSGHTHPGITDASLVVSDGDRKILIAFKQGRSSLYNASGRHALVTTEVYNYELGSKKR